MPADFLMQQMEWREAVDVARDAEDVSELERLRIDIRRSRDEMLVMLERALDADANFVAGCSLVRKLRFLEKLEAEIDSALELTEH